MQPSRPRGSFKMNVNIKYVRMTWGPEGRKVVVGQLRSHENNDVVVMGDSALSALLTHAVNKNLVILNAQEVLTSLVVEMGFAA